MARHEDCPTTEPDSWRVRLRRQAGSKAVDAFFRWLSKAGRLHPSARPQRHHVAVTRDLPYLNSGRPEHLLDIYRPTNTPGPWPVVLYLHGGGFRVLSKDSHWVMGLAFARRGALVFNANYRLAPQHPYPAAMQDACAALTWVLEHAARHGGDPDRLVLAGESAGANLALGLTLACCYRRPEPWARAVWDTGAVPRAVLPACGVFQVSDPERFGRRRHLRPWVLDRLTEVRDAYLGAAPRPAAEHELADPLLVLEQGAAPARPLPPFLIAAGTRDPLLDDTRRLAAALHRLDVACEAHYYPGEIHAFHALTWRRNARRYWGEAYRFVDRHV